MAYGFEARRADGSLMISSTDGVARLIYSADLAEDYSGTINVPAFDSNLGYYTVRVYPFKNIISGGTGTQPAAEDTSWSVNGRYAISICQALKPTLSWNNATKDLTVTANADTENAYWHILRYRYRLFMVHYK